MNRIPSINPVVGALHEAVGPPRPDELPEVGLYRSNHDFLKAASQFAENPEDKEVQEKFTGSREALRGQFNVFVHEVMQDYKVLGRGNVSAIVSGAYRHNQEERHYGFQQLFPEGSFGQLSYTRKELSRRIGLILMSKDSVSDAERLRLAVRVSDEFSRSLGKDVHSAFVASLVELQEPEEPELEELHARNLEHEEEDITMWMTEQDIAATYQAGIDLFTNDALDSARKDQ